jgi:Mor family transcriptional regulator
MEQLRSHGLIDEWMLIIARELVSELKLPSDKASTLGNRIALAIADDFAGQQIYVPNFFSVEIAARHKEIYEKYRSKDDIPELCREYDITERHLYRILAQVRAQDLASRQSSLFDAGVAK